VDGARRHAGRPQRGRGTGVLAGLALLAGAAAVRTAPPSEPPVLAEPAPRLPAAGASARPAGLDPSSAPRPVLGPAPSLRTRGIPVWPADGAAPVSRPAPPSAGTELIVQQEPHAGTGRFRPGDQLLRART
jgi:hypothetical protein